jgi:hypothetical protein
VGRGGEVGGEGGGRGGGAAWNWEKHWNFLFMEEKEDVGPARGGGGARKQSCAFLASQVSMVCG